MAKAKGLYAKIAHEPIFHKTSIGRNPSLCKMNKSKRRMFKKYRGQGRWQRSLNILYWIYERKKDSNIYEAGNLVNISFKSRTEDMLGFFLVELTKPSPLLYLNDLKKRLTKKTKAHSPLYKAINTNKVISKKSFWRRSK